MTKYVNPFTIYKDTSPYMYLTDQSGIFVNEYETVATDRGISLSINTAAQTNYNLMQLQVWVRYQSPTFGAAAPMMEITSQSGTIIFNVVPEDNGQRASLSSTYADIDFYQNGVKTSYPVIYPEEWTAINMVFTTPLSFSLFNGSIVLRKGFLFNNISEYVYENALNIISKSLQKEWSEILFPDVTNQLVTDSWGDTLALGTWAEATVTITQHSYSIRGDYIYNDQTGTSVIISEDISHIEVFSNGADILTDVTWQTFERNAV